MRKLLAHRRQFLVFLAGGLLCAAIDIGVMQALIAEGVHYMAAASTGFAAGLLVNYTFHARLTFAAPATAFNFMRYLCVVGLNYLLTLACVGAAAALVGSPLAGKLASLPLIAVSGFLLSKFWVYK